jgi:hypothetical protein
VPSASEGHRKRLSRIRRRAAKEVQEAFLAGHISARKADVLLYLEPEQQRLEIAGSWLSVKLLHGAVSWPRLSFEITWPPADVIWQASAGICSSP